MKPQYLIADFFEQLQGGWRYRWVAVGVSWLVCVVGWLYVSGIPDIYRASARVYVDTNSLIKPLMQGLTAQQNTLNEVQLVSTAVLTRPNLESVAHETDLALRATTPQQFEDLITGLQERIRVTGGRDNIFTIQYEDNSREKAVDVVAAVLDTFVEDAIGAQGNDAELTERALKGEIDDHEQRLRNAEETLAEFKKENLGFMPGESGDYYTRLQTALSGVSSSEDKIRGLEERRVELSRQVAGEQPVFGIMSTGLGGLMSACSQSAELDKLKKQLSDLLVDFTDKHPRVVTLNEQISTIEARCTSEAATTNLPAIDLAQDEPLEVNPVYQNLRIQLSSTEVDLAEARRTLKSYQDAVAGLRRDVDKIAQVETQLKQLNRDYDVVQQRHQELLRRWEDLQAKKRLDPVTDDVQFRRIEPPFALADPVGPKRPLFLTAVFLLGLAAGGAVAFGLNKLHPAYFSRRTVQTMSGLPVLGSVTMLLTPQAARRDRFAAVALVAAYVFLFVSTGLVIGFARDVAGVVRAALAAGGLS